MYEESSQGGGKHPGVTDAPGNGTSLASTLPEEMQRLVAVLSVVEVGFAAGPGLAARAVQQHAPPIALLDALAYLERLRGIWKRAHVQLAGGGRLYFTPDGYIAEDR